MKYWLKLGNTMYFATVIAKGKIYSQIHVTVFILMCSPSHKAKEAHEKMLLRTLSLKL